MRKSIINFPEKGVYEYEVYLPPVVRDGDYYFTLTKPRAAYETVQSHYLFDNLYNGDEFLGKQNQVNIHMLFNPYLYSGMCYTAYPLFAKTLFKSTENRCHKSISNKVTENVRLFNLISFL